MKKAALHIFGIIFIVGYQNLVMTALGDTLTWKGVLTFMLQIATFYANLLWVVPLAGDYRKELRIITYLIIVVLLHIIIRGWIIKGFSIAPEFWQFIFSSKQILLASLQLLFVLGLSLFVGIHNLSLRRKKDYEMVQSIMAQLQLNPHLLFNALHFIDEKASETLPEVSHSTRQLAGVLRHSLIDIDHIQKISLETEIEQMHSYISLCRQLADKQIYIDFTTDVAHAGNELKIPPLLLITFLENMFKYAVLDDEDTPAAAKLSVQGNQLEFHTFNFKRMVSGLSGGGHGINNSSRILAYYYPGRHTLQVSATEETFTLTLKIKL